MTERIPICRECGDRDPRRLSECGCITCACESVVLVQCDDPEICGRERDEYEEGLELPELFEGEK